MHKVISGLLLVYFICHLSCQTNRQVAKDITTIQQTTTAVPDKTVAQDYNIPYAELSGFWKPVYYKNGDKTIDQSKRNDEAGIGFHFPHDTLPGQLRWNDGCNSCGNLYFRHIGDGIIEIQQSGTSSCTEIGCDINQQLVSFIRKMVIKQTKTTVTNEGQTLELSLDEETFTLRKIHSNTHPALSTELFGNWKPVKGKLQGKTINTFAKNAKVTFGKRKDDYPKTGSIQYKEDKECNSEGVDLIYMYLDDDFLTFHYYRNVGKPKICSEEFLLGKIFYWLSHEGCHVRFTESKQTVTFEYKDNSLVLRRI